MIEYTRQNSYSYRVLENYNYKFIKMVIKNCHEIVHTSTLSKT